MVIIQLFLVHKWFTFDIKWKNIIQYLISFTLIFIFSYFSYKFSLKNDLWYLYFSFSIIFSFIILFISKIISLKEIKAFVKKSDKD